jgi:transcriptional antiterminator Rof (Rho-off)
MANYQPVPRAAFEALEEAYLLRQPVILTYEQDFMRKTLLNVRITDLYQQEDGEYLTLEGGLHLRLDQLVAIGGKPVHFWA